MDSEREIDKLAAKLYHEIFQDRNYYRLSANSKLKENFRNISKDILKGKYTK